ncbi:PQQ-dependent sugar dehydrogenase [Glutamicibacter halophytocola]|uniref:PQQ-dependent sugar dehydrogenase n=1 Tax=Glutamicibacter halophytocola TaxID=1933880 RepID=A0ABX5YB54_9MICC|nr:PQQ-dependent sugar dehydrogenase [Glutamicibacter halophytocola]QDY66890.1 PQQ-dependent sugar dehydrogenase [Glutamicibacter halophytocola]
MKHIRDTCLLLGAVFLAGCSTPTPLPSPAAESQTAPEPLATGLEAPWSMVYVQDSLLVSERDSGRILEVSQSGQSREVARIDDLAARGEGGLLGLAFLAPDQLYAYSTAESGNRIQQFTVQGSAGNLSLSAPRTLLDSLPSANIHNGGRLAIGPDGMLYASVGDASNPGQAQDLQALGGKILRMAPDGSVPEDNPFENSLVYSYGHRNVQGLAWSDDGTMYASEFGQNTFDELNIIKAGGNYGWPEVEGKGGADRQYTDPIAQWSPAEASPSGIAILDGTAYLANLRGEVLRAVELDAPAIEQELLDGRLGRLRDVLVDPGGSLLVLTNNTDGRGRPGTGDDRIVRIDPGQPGG